MIDQLEFRVLGGLRVQRAGVDLDLGGPRQRRLLAVLLLSCGRPVPPDRLAELVWDDEAPASARASLQSYVSKLRTILEPVRRPGAPAGVLVSRPAGYVLDVDPATVDLLAFEQAIDAGRAALAAGRPAGAVARLGPAVAGWAPVLPELADVPVVVAAARRAEAVRTAGFEALQRARVAAGDHHAALPDLEAALVADPRAEPLWALLALALHRAGRPAEALDAVTRARRSLREASGLDVGEELRHLEARLLAPTAPEARAARTVASGPRCRRVGTRACPRLRA